MVELTEEQLANRMKYAEFQFLKHKHLKRILAEQSEPEASSVQDRPAATSSDEQPPEKK